MGSVGEVRVGSVGEVRVGCGEYGRVDRGRECCGERGRGAVGSLGELIGRDGMHGSGECCAAVVALLRTCNLLTSLPQNCILLFKELPLNLWVPESRDMHLIHHWLVELPLLSHESKLAKVILSGLNWGIKSEVGGSIIQLSLPYIQ